MNAHPILLLPLLGALAACGENAPPRPYAPDAAPPRPGVEADARGSAAQAPPALADENAALAFAIVRNLRDKQGDRRTDFLESKRRDRRGAPALADGVFAALPTLEAHDRAHAIDLLVALGPGADAALARELDAVVGADRADEGVRSTALVALTVALRRGADAVTLLPAIEALTDHADTTIASIARQAQQRVGGHVVDPRFGR